MILNKTRTVRETLGVKSFRASSQKHTLTVLDSLLCFPNGLQSRVISQSQAIFTIMFLICTKRCENALVTQYEQVVLI